MTAPVANPSLRWLLAYLGAAISGSLFATVGTWAVTGTAPGVAGYVSRILPFAAIGLFVPVAIASILLMKSGFWTLPGFIVAGAAVPALFFLLVALGNAPGANFWSTFIVWTVSGALAGAVFHMVWERLS